MNVGESILSVVEAGDAKGQGSESPEIGAKEAYRLARRELLGEVSAAFFNSYIEPLRFIAEWNGKLIFCASSPAAKERLNQQTRFRLESLMKARLPNIAGVDILLAREVPEEVLSLADAAEQPEVAAPSPLTGGAEESLAPTTEPAAEAVQPNSYTFEHFCVDQTNFRAFAVAQMVASGAGRSFPVVLIHSPPGWGKTHLMHAIKYESQRINPEREVLLMSGQEFLERFQSALHKDRDSATFKHKVRAPDLLLIDEVQRMCGKRATSEELMHTIVALNARGSQVVLTANHSAQGLEGLDDQLREKLKSATTCEIFEGGQELRRRILDSRVRHHMRDNPKFSVADSALEMIAERMPVSGRELDGAVSQLVLESQILNGMEVSVEAAASALQGKLNDSAERRITVQIVQKVVARHYNMSVQQLLERTRRQNIARPRQICMYLATQMTKNSLPDIGERFGGFDHTTIMYARDKVAELIKTNGGVAQEVEALKQLIRREG